MELKIYETAKEREYRDMGRKYENPLPPDKHSALYHLIYGRMTEEMIFSEIKMMCDDYLFLNEHELPDGLLELLTVIDRREGDQE